MNERRSRIVCGVWCLVCAVLSILVYFRNSMMQPYLPILEIALPIGMVILSTAAWLLHWKKSYVSAEFIFFCVTLFVMSGLYSIDRWKALFPGLFMIEADRWAVMTVVIVILFVLMMGVWFIRKRWQERGTNQSEKLFGLLLVWCFFCVAGSILSFFFYDQMRPLLIGIDMVGVLCILAFWGVAYFYLQAPEKYQYAVIGTMTGMTALICINRLYAGTTWKELIPALEKVDSYWITAVCLAVLCIAWLFGAGSVWMIQRGKRERGETRGNGLSSQKTGKDNLKKWIQENTMFVDAIITVIALILMIIFYYFRNELLDWLQVEGNSVAEKIVTLTIECTLIVILFGVMIRLIGSFIQKCRDAKGIRAIFYGENGDSFTTHAISIVILGISYYLGKNLLDFSLTEVSNKLDDITSNILIPLMIAVLLVAFESIIYHFIKFLPKIYDIFKDDFKKLNEKVQKYIKKIMTGIVEFILGIILSAVRFVDSIPDFFDAFYELVFHEPNQIVRIIKIVSFMLALVSWIATAQGLQQYIFTESEFQAYAVSFGIQGLLFVVNLNIMDYLIGKKEEKAKQQNANGTGEQETADLEGSEETGGIQTRAAGEAAATTPHAGGKTQENKGFWAIIKEAWSEFGANVAKTIRGILWFPWTVWGKKIVLLRMLLLLCLIGLSSGFSYIYIVTMVYEDTRYADIDAKLQKEYQDIYSQTAEYANRKKASLLMDIYGTVGELVATGGNKNKKDDMITLVEYNTIKEKLTSPIKYSYNDKNGKQTNVISTPAIDASDQFWSNCEGVNLFANLSSMVSLPHLGIYYMGAKGVKLPTYHEICEKIEEGISHLDERIKGLSGQSSTSTSTVQGMLGSDEETAALESQKQDLKNILEKYQTNDEVEMGILSTLEDEETTKEDIKENVDKLSKGMINNPDASVEMKDQLKTTQKLKTQLDAFDIVKNTILSSENTTEDSLKKLKDSEEPTTPVQNIEMDGEKEIKSYKEDDIKKWKEAWRVRLDGLKAIIQILYETQGTMDALEEEAETESSTTEPATTEPATTEPATAESATAVTESPARTSILAGILQWLLPNKKTSEEPVVSDQEVLMNNIHTLQDMERNYLGHVNVLEQGILYLTDGEYKNLARVSLFFALAMDLFSMYAGYLTSLAWKEGEKKEKAIESGILKMKRK